MACCTPKSGQTTVAPPKAKVNSPTLYNSKGLVAFLDCSRSCKPKTVYSSKFHWVLGEQWCGASKNGSKKQPRRRVKPLPGVTVLLGDRTWQPRSDSADGLRKDNTTELAATLAYFRVDPTSGDDRTFG